MITNEANSDSKRGQAKSVELDPNLPPEVMTM